MGGDKFRHAQSIYSFKNWRQSHWVGLWTEWAGNRQTLLRNSFIIWSSHALDLIRKHEDISSLWTLSLTQTRVLNLPGIDYWTSPHLSASDFVYTNSRLCLYCGRIIKILQYIQALVSSSSKWKYQSKKMGTFLWCLTLSNLIMIAPLPVARLI